MKKSGQKNYTVTIGIVGADDHVGVTHLAIMIANYLSSKERFRVAVIDLSQRNSLLELQKIHDSCDKLLKKELMNETMFQVHKVDYYSYVSQRDIANILHLGYRYVIVDFGKVVGEYEHEILRCHQRILVGSCCEWQQNQFKKAVEMNVMSKDHGIWAYAAFLGINEIRHGLEKKYRIQIHKIPYVEDPFCLSRIHFEPLKNILLEA